MIHTMRPYLLVLLLIVLSGCLSWQSGTESPAEQQQDQQVPPPDSLAEQPTTKSAEQPFTPNKIQQLPLEVTATITHPVTILGKAGFSPAELTIEAGDAVTWTNADPQKKALTLTFQEETTRNFLASPLITPTAEWTGTFTEPREYRYWTVGYGITGLLVVKETD